MMLNDLPYDILLGRDVLTEHKILLDFASGSLILQNGERLKLQSPTITIKAKQACFISPKSSQMIPIDFEPPFKETDQYMLEKKITLKEVIPTNAVINANTARILVSNFSGKPQEIKKGQELASAILATDNFYPSLINDSDTISPEPNIESIKPLLDDILSNKLLDTIQKQDAIKLLKEYQHLFTLSNSDLGIKCNIEHSIITGDVYPLKQQPYRVSEAERQEIGRQLDQMLQDGILSETKFSDSQRRISVTTY